MNIHKIVARDLPDLWFQAVHDVFEHGRRFVIDRGSYAGQTRLEYDYFIGHVLDPGYGSGTAEILPQIPASLGIPNPVDVNYVYGGEGYSKSYIEYLMTAAKEKGESYTYGQRLAGYPVPHSIIHRLVENQDCYVDDSIMLNEKLISPIDRLLNQIEMVIHIYKTYGYRNNQMILQVAKPDDCLQLDPPCLRHIDTRIQDNTLHFFVYFRSWDLWAGLPANLAAIQALKESMAAEIGVEDGEMLVESKGLHLYGYAEKLGKLRCMKGEKGD